MSTPRSRIIHPLADHDLKKLLEWSIDRWSDRQALIYAQLLDKGLDTITAFPQIGKLRDDLRPGLCSFLVGRHIILYEEQGNDTIVVLRIIHQHQQLDDLSFE